MRIKELEAEDNSNIILMNPVELNGVSIWRLLCLSTMLLKNL